MKSLGITGYYISRYTEINAWQNVYIGFLLAATPRKKPYLFQPELYSAKYLFAFCSTDSSKVSKNIAAHNLSLTYCFKAVYVAIYHAVPVIVMDGFEWYLFFLKKRNKKSISSK